MSKTTGSTSEYDDKVYTYLKKYGKRTRPQLVDELNIPRSSLFDSLNRLLIANLIVKDSDPVKPGRPSVYFKVNW